MRQDNDLKRTSKSTTNCVGVFFVFFKYNKTKNSYPKYFSAVLAGNNGTNSC